MRHFLKIAEGLDVQPILVALAAKPWLWNQFDLRTTHPQSPHQDCDDILVRFNDTSDPSAVIDDLDCIPYPAWTELPIQDLVLNVMRAVRGVRLGRVIISRLAPGASIAPHVDQGAPATYYTRYHVALQSGPGALNISGDETIIYQPGELWWFDNRVEHEIVNNGADDRIALVIDVRVE